MNFDQIADAIKQYHPNPDLEIVRRAYDFAAKAHQGQVRASGEPYLNHLCETAILICRLKLDIPSVVAGLLHDTIEDCVIGREELTKQFGHDIAEIVEGVTKLTRIEIESKEVRQVESFRKMLIAMAKDIRVVLVKLCDRLHNMRSLSFLGEQRRRRISQETVDIYAPLANRLGIHWLKSELEDLCLLYLRPEIYKLIDEKYKLTASGRELYISETTEVIRKTFEENGIAASVKGRVKHYYSIWKKMEENNLTFEEIHDLLGFRVIVPSLRACYESLGIIHATWKPIANRFKDYIAMPKPNMYQSLHTTVIGPSGQRIELQIRTPEMNRVAEDGIAAHWKYKEGNYTTESSGFDLQWVSELVETQQYLKNPDEFIQSVKGELFPEEVFVFTPKGDLIRLPYGSTVVDFAFYVHSDVGGRATGARVNGQLVPLECRIENGDTVEIITSKNHVPNKDWLKFVKTSKAKQRIRQYLKSEERLRSEEIGQELLAKDLRKVKESIKKLEKNGKLMQVAEELGFKSYQELYAAVGYGKLNATKVLAKIVPEGTEINEKAKTGTSSLERIFQKAAKASRQKVGVKVSGYDDLLVRFAKCCEPLPGDRVVGFITRGRGVTVHLANCAQVMKSDTLRQVDVVWDTAVKVPRRVRITVHSQDQIGLLANVTGAITSNGANIANAQVQTTNYGKAINSFELMIDDARQLESITRAIEMVPGVIRVDRVRHLVTNVSLNDGEE